jgi:hypothetical protein
MKSPKRSSFQPTQIHCITDNRTAEYLLKPQHQDELLMFIKAEYSVSACAKALGLPLRKAFSLVERLQKHGLIVVSRLEPRKGRAIRHYKAVADGFFIAKSLVPLEQMLEVLGGDLDARLNRHFIKAFWERAGTLAGLQLLVTQKGGIGCLLAEAPGVLLSAPKPDEMAMYNMWHEWQLSFADAKALQQDLRDLSNKYAAKATASQKYLVRLAMTPMG